MEGTGRQGHRGSKEEEKDEQGGGGEEICQKGDKPWSTLSTSPWTYRSVFLLDISTWRPKSSFCSTSCFSSQRHLSVNIPQFKRDTVILPDVPITSLEVSLILAFPSLSTQSTGKSYFFHYQNRPQFYLLFSIYTTIVQEVSFCPQNSCHTIMVRHILFPLVLILAYTWQIE